jgi:5-methylcytosine-specific restriction protein A
MSPRAYSPCATPSCPTLVEGGGHCPTHRSAKRKAQAKQRRQAGDPSMDAYTTGAWRTTRTTYLATHPHCVDCGAQATQPDHVPPRVLLVALGIHDPDHERWLQPRCAPCHGTKTRVVDDPIIRRWQQGEDAHALVDEAMRRAHSYTRSARTT